MKLRTPSLALLLAACASAPQRANEPAQAASPQPVRAVTPSSDEETGVPAARFRTVADDPFVRIDDIDWPGPNQYRSSNGAPGPRYWQQRADYVINATLDTATQTVSGDVTIRYTNNSPDTLQFVWIQLDQNLYRRGSVGSALFPADSRWGVRGFEGGYDLRDITVNGKATAYRVDDTMMRVDLETTLRPNGGVATVAMRFAFRVPEHGSDRMGRDGMLYEIAQWYPRMAVYDDVRGWNADPYLGQGEFYLEYGDYEYGITAPAGYTIAASGVLQNPAEVLSAEQRTRLSRASKTEDVVGIITLAEAKATQRAGTKTWRFRAENVRDVAWAGAPDFRWDATSWNGIVAQAYFQPSKTGKAWDQAAEQTQWSLKTYSKLFLYPYPQATSVAGPVGGMEYPMFVMVHYGRNNDPNTVFGTIDHEHGHAWFPMIVGSNERRYAWMDEGFNTYINAFSNELRYPGTSAWTRYFDNWRQVVQNRTQAPLMTPADRINPGALGAIGYRKPAAVLLALRNHVVGRESFDAAFVEYIRRWAFKHPTPGDFFRTIENQTGKDLSWYWKGFFYSDDVMDIGVQRVEMRTDDSGSRAVVTLGKMTSIPFPVALRLKLSDGTTMDAKFPVEIWSRGDRFDAEVSVKEGSKVVGVRLWPDPSVPDWNTKNDVWGEAPAADKLGPAGIGNRQ